MTAQTFKFIVQSTILRGEKANKPLEAIEAATPHQMNRLIGYLPDGTKAVIAQRPGKGGMDFTKLMGGKVFAVAADGTSPVFEKDSEGKPTKNQKHEDGLPLYSSSGFYLLSSRDYPALDLGEYFTLLRENGSQVLMISDAQVANAQKVLLDSEFDLELVGASAQEALSDHNNLVTRFDEGINRKRRRAIERAQEEAQDAGEDYTGVAFKELSASKKDGNPALVAFWQIGGNHIQSTVILREILILDAGERPVTQYVDAAQAWEQFTATLDYQSIVAALNEGTPVTFGFVPAHAMRTSVSFRRKVENVMAAPTEKAQFGDAVYIQGAMRGWCRGIVGIMQSQHPNFPAADYEAHHYVVAVRQAEVGMNRTQDNTSWLPPQIIHVDPLAAVPA
jgi:hypothetical protein